jgi:hypothetical protein
MSHSQSAEPNPPRWMERLLRMMLKPRDRDTVSGDLLEEYREAIFSAKGKLRADLWYLRQTVSLVNGISFGLILGVLLSAWILLGSLVFLVGENWAISPGRVTIALFHPLVFNTPLEMVAMLCALYLCPGIPGFLCRRQGGKFIDALKAGAAASALALAVTAVAGDIRMNIVLAIISRRPESHLALQAFANGQNLIAHANYYYAIYVPERVLLGAAFGAVAGTLGALIAQIYRPTLNKLQNS